MATSASVSGKRGAGSDAGQHVHHRQRLADQRRHGHGTSNPITINAVDPYGNLATNYTGTVHFTSSDTAAVLPADYTFVANDHGIHTFNYTLKTAGAQTITATDASNPSLGFQQPVDRRQSGRDGRFPDVVAPAVEQAAGYAFYPDDFRRRRL